MNTPAAKKTPLAFWKLLLFKIAALLLIPLLFFGIVEGALHVIQYGGDSRLFIQDEKTGTLIFSHSGFENWLRPRKMMKETPKKETGRTLWRHPATLTIHKQAGSLRVFCLGASTTQGFPLYETEAAFPGELKKLLQKNFPNHEVELLNLGISGIGTSIIQDLLREVLPLEPDAVVLYAGQNEFAGYLGSTSKAGLSSRPGLIRAHLFLARFRTYAALQDLFFKTFLKDRDPGEKNLISFLPQEATLVPEDAVFQKTILNYQSHMESMVEACKEKNIPLILCTTATNLEDFPPFRSFHRPALTEQEKTLFSNTFYAGLAKLKQKSLAEASTLFQKALAISPKHASCHYYLGKTLRGLQQHEQADRHFSLARDLDGIKMRAPDDFNRTLKLLAIRLNLPLADCELTLKKASLPEQPGASFFYEHVHPILEGHQSIAETILKSIGQAIAPQKKMVTKMTLHAIPYQSPINDWASRTMVYSLTKDYPFRPLHHTPLPDVPAKLQPFIHHFHLIPPQIMHLIYAHILASEHKFKEAQAEAEIALELEPAYPSALHFQSLLESPDSLPEISDKLLWQYVSDYYLQKKQVYPEEASHSITLGYIASLLGHHENARQHNQQALIIDPQSQKAAFNMAQSYQATKEHDKALDYYEKAHQLNPKDSQNAYQLAFLHKAEKRYPEAEHWLKVACKQNPTASAWFNLAVFYIEQKDWQQAEETLEKALSSDPHYARAWYQKALIAHEQNRTGEAMQHLRQSILKQPTFFPSYHKLADIARKQNQPGIARDTYLKCLQMNPEQLDACLNLGHLYLQEGLLLEAKNLYQAFLNFYPRESRLYANLGAVALQNNSLEEADQYYQQAIQLNPRDALIYFNLALIYHDQGDQERALKTLRHGLTLRPNDRAAKNLLKEWEETSGT